MTRVVAPGCPGPHPHRPAVAGRADRRRGHRAARHRLRVRPRLRHRRLGRRSGAAGAVQGRRHQPGVAADDQLHRPITPIADFGAYEAANNPAGGPVDSNAYGLEVLATRAVIADAGANALLQIDQTLSLSTLAVFANRTVPGPGGMGTVEMEAVPTSIAEGPDGSLYVGQLTGFPFPVGGARVYRVPAGGGTPTIVAEGFTNIIDIAIGPDGAAYVLEHDANSLLGSWQRRPADQDRPVRPAHRAGRRAAGGAGQDR